VSETGITGESQLNEFLAYLGRNGLASGVGERVRAIRVIARFGAAAPSPRWKPLLCPIFARSPGEQERFSQAFDFFFDETKEEAPPPLPGQARLVQLSEGTRRRSAPWRRIWPWALAALVLIALVHWRVPELLYDLTRAAILSVPEAPPLPDVRTALRPDAPGMTRRTVEQKKTEYYQHSCAGWDCVSRGWRPWALGTPLVLLVLGLAGASTSQWKRMQLRKRELRRSPPLTWPAVAGTPRLAGYQEMFTNAARAMNQRLAADSDRLDVNASLRATVRAGGFPSIRFRREQLLPEYLFLIEQRTAGDHFAAWWTAISGELRALGVRVDCYYHGGDSRRVRSASGAVTLTTARLLDLCPNHSVLLLGESAVLLNPYSGELATWAAMLKSRENRAVLTPEASFEWGQREAAVGRHLTILPARVRHLPAVLKSFDSYHRRSAELAESEETAPIPDQSLEDAGEGADGPDEGTALGLQLYFDPVVFQWLCGCAVHPELQWELTVELGRIVDPSEAVLNEAKLLQLIRLRWFRQGRIPGPWRVWLVKQLEPAMERRVREFLVSAMLKNRAPEGTYARDWQDLQIGAQQYWLTPSDARLRADLELAMAEMPAADVNRDVLLRQLKEQWKERGVAERLASAPRVRWRDFLRGGWKGVAVTALLVAAAGLLAMRVQVEDPREVKLTTYEYELTPVARGGSPNPEPLRAGATKVNPKDGLTYVWVPPGTFRMGCSTGDKECESDEEPAHQVTITKGFWMGRTEVTQEAYQRVMGTNPSHFKGAKLPVEQISWNDAQSYCQKADMRLPTEAEWEYAARAGTKGGRYSALSGIAWYLGNSGGKAHEVAQKQPNAWGLYDMLGNVFEWVADWFASQYPAGNATDPRGPAAGTYRTLRGDAWFDSPRTSFRTRYEPAFHSDFLGCRCGGN
jgi:formylglycine-generating enzyme required for sulfatase activity